MEYLNKGKCCIYTDIKGIGRVVVYGDVLLNKIIYVLKDDRYKSGYRTEIAKNMRTDALGLLIN